jgi:HEPN domain-containing protein
MGLLLGPTGRGEGLEGGLPTARGGEAWGHSVTALLDHLPSDLTPPAELFDQAKMLDRYYIPTRYPNSFAQGAPKDYFTKRDAEEAINCARNIIAFCERYISHA